MGRNQYNHSLNDLKNIGSYVRLVDDEGNHLPVARVHSLSFAASAEDRGLLNWLYVPLDELEHVDHTNLLTHLRMQQSIDLEWFKGFGTRAFYQYENQSTYGENLRNQYSFAARDLINRFSDLRSETVVRNVPLGGILLKSTQRTAVHNGRIEGYYSKLHGSHNFQLIGGLEIRQAITSGGNQVIYGYDPMTGIGKAVNQDSLYVLFPAENRGTISGFNGVSQMIDRFRSYYFNGAYTLNQLYVFSASARIDQSNLFGVRANQRSVPLWSAGFKWNISQEHAYRLEWLPTLQLRATYGYNGNMDNSLTAYATMRYFDDGTGLNIARVENTPNPHLRWEKTALLNVGMDFRLAEGFVSGSLDYYHKRGMDLIGYGPLESTTGRTVFRGNVAGMRGDWLDVEFHFLPFPAGQIRWTGTLWASFISDKVTEYRADPPTISAYFGDASLPGSDYTPQKGVPLFSVYSYPWAGLDPQTGAPRGYLDGVASTYRL